MPSTNIFTQDTFVFDPNGSSDQNISITLDDLSQKISRFDGKKTVVFANSANVSSYSVSNGTLGPYNFSDCEFIFLDNASTSETMGITFASGIVFSGFPSKISGNVSFFFPAGFWTPSSTYNAIELDNATLSSTSGVTSAASIVIGSGKTLTINISGSGKLQGYSSATQRLISIASGGTLKVNLDDTASVGNYVTTGSGTYTLTDNIGTIASQSASSVSITGGTITGITDLAIADGGTGASTASGARTNLGLTIGVDVQSYSAILSSISAGSWTGVSSITTLGTVTAGTWTASTIGPTYGGTGVTSYALGDTLYASATNTLSKLSGNTTTTRQFLRQTGTGSASAAPAWDTVTKTDVGLSNVENTALSTWTGSSNLANLGTIASGVWNGTAIPVAYGGTGSTTAAAARTALGLAINTDVQGYSANLQGLGGVFVPGITSTSRYFYSFVSGSYVAMGCYSTLKYAWFGSLSTNDDVVILAGNLEVIQFDKATGTIHPFSASISSADLGTASLPFRNLYYSNQITSSVATGTAPLVVTSTTEVANLNASRVAGKVPTATPAANALPLANSSGKLDAGWIPGLKSQTLVDGPTINWDMSLGTAATVTLGATGRTMAAPTNLPSAGTTGVLVIIQDATGSRTITTWNAIFKWPGGTAITLSTGASKRDIIEWYYDGTSIYMMNQNKNY